MVYKMKRIEEINKSHKESLDSINRYLTDENVGKYINWLANTEINPYSFLPEEMASGFGTSEGFEFICHMVHHALVDDGDISFVICGEQPKIIFQYRYDYVPKKVKEYKLINDENGKPKLDHILVDEKVKFLESFDEFIIEVEKYERDHTMRCFYLDADRLGKEFAFEHYSKDPFFDTEWINQEPPEHIQKTIKSLRGLKK